MDPSPQAGSSSVTVEYTDPSGLFPLVQPVIADKLPLKNLHWKSPTRPVRSIESLRIGFVPAQNETDDRKSSSDTARGMVTHRRHQIPGLRQTPYLKIYLLHCDDNDTYKNTARKALREWIKSHASMSHSSIPTTSQEKHDAFEWLILHVVQDDGTEKAVPASKWGRTTTTVLEKVKADFNGASKTAVDRVAQLRLPKAGATQKVPELADQLEDFVEKIKNAILTSFDLRVAQYEEDIKEKDSQRSLPGWNFCTFFILKEGLARGFENVGLFEDALLGYDELSVGLDTAINEQLEGSGEQHGSAFLTYSKDWQDKAKAVLDSKESVQLNENDDEQIPIPDLDPGDFPIDPSKKSYREMILSSNISIFDFRTYVFSRQVMLLLRAARAPSLVNKELDASQKSAKTLKKPEDLLLLSEVCERSAEFISLGARTLRYDLECGLSGVDNAAKTQVINNLVASWAYSATLQILSQTYTASLTLPEPSLRSIGKAMDVASSAEAIPKRSSSLVSPHTTRPARSNTEILTPGMLSSIPSRSGRDVPKSAPPISPKTGSEQLASGRGELYLMARRELEEIAGRCGWNEKWNNLGLLFGDKNTVEDELAEVSLDEHPKSVEESPTPNALLGIELPSLTAALRSSKSFRSHFEELTDLVYRNHITANRTYTAHMALADMALLRFRQGNYSVAASYFHQITPFYGNKGWIILEGVMLELYARCLRELQRTEEYVRVILRLLAKFAIHTQSGLSPRQKTLDASAIFAEKAQASQYVEELFEAAKTLQKELSAPLSDFFADFEVNPVILHYETKDGFQMQLSLRFLLGKSIDIDSIKIRLVSSSRGQSSEHWIETSAKTTIKSSPTKIQVDSSTTLQGRYFIDRVEVRAGNILFTFGGGKYSALPVGFRESVDNEEDNLPYIYCYPPPLGLQARIGSPHQINLEEMRTLELELNSGWNDIKTGTIRVRPATAGLRLRITEVEVMEGDINIVVNTEAGNIEFTHLAPNSFVRIRIPYTVEEHHATLSARAEIGYETANGRFSYSSTHSIASALPISVNVQDTFKDRVLFSRFTISPAMMTPLRILKCNIPSSDVYQVQSNTADSVAMNVFPKQPASLLYKIQQREENVKSPGLRRSLRLSVDFTCVDDECIDALEKTFRTSISASEFRQYTTLLTAHIVEAFRTRLSPTEMETVGLVREVETLSYESVRWEGFLSVLKAPMEGLKRWLQEWHQNHPVLSLPQQPSIPRRHIVIPVDIPEVQVVHTAELRLTNLFDQPPHAAVGQMITAELSLRHTRRWCSPQHRENAGGPLEFSYEIHPNPELWLVGGRRRGNFTADEGESKTFAMTLLPQKAGHLLLPGLEIRTFVPPSSTTSAPPPGGAGVDNTTLVLQRRQVACEVDYRNHGETVLVLPDLRATTVSLSLSGGNHGGAWLIDSERREV
ncbi:hypothetical protein EYZ11_006218 [Aspergillus tanneri]|uniref:Trafficking protein particle complex subunit 10 n=1 Tax=Aspergillus tanneri TaxID=1220188 RepID=A0A4S3JGD1_9EURO|nr:uncharacterized protein ATNIH1004_000756 [Aspergillus tanneri]KAA8651858.1 hypothetical protein ATNIH1004_000756 [Aspergillus tanneri]THC94312.1 hypothetical protein EYZ11_006218 [Aspergillus tanneri]